MPFFGTRFVAPRIKSSSAQIKARIEQLQAELPALQQAYTDAAVVWADETALDPSQRHDDVDLDTLRDVADTALRAVKDVEDQLRILESQLPAVEAREDQDRLAAEERVQAEQRADKQRSLDKLVRQLSDELKKQSSIRENLAKSMARIDTLRSEANGIVPILSDHDLDRAIERENAELVSADGQPIKPLWDLAAELVEKSRGAVERRHNWDDESFAADVRFQEERAEVDRRNRERERSAEHPEWDGFLAPEPMEFPLPQERNREAYIPSDFGTWPPPMPKDQSPAVCDEPTDDGRVAAANEPAPRAPAITGTGDAADLPPDDGTGAGLDDPAYIAEARRMGVPADVI